MNTTHVNKPWVYPYRSRWKHTWAEQLWGWEKGFLRKRASWNDSFSSGHIRPGPETDIFNIGVPSPLDFLKFLQWIVCFFSSNLEGGSAQRGSSECSFFWLYRCFSFCIFTKSKKFFPPHMSSFAAFLVPLDFGSAWTFRSTFPHFVRKTHFFPGRSKRPLWHVQTWSERELKWCTCAKGDLTCNHFAEIKDMMQWDCLILPVAAIRKPRSDHQLSHAISKAQWGRHQRDSLIHRTWEIGERGGFGNKENKRYLPSPRSRRKAETMPDGDWQAHSFPRSKTNCSWGFNVETNSVFYFGACRKGFGRIPFFFRFFLFSVFFHSSVFFFLIPVSFFRFFSVSSSVCCSQVSENPLIGYFVEGKGIRVEGSGFLGLRVPGLKV